MEQPDELPIVDEVLVIIAGYPPLPGFPPYPHTLYEIYPYPLSVIYVTVQKHILM